MSIRQLTVILPIPAVVSQHVTTKSRWVCVKNEKYEFSVTQRQLMSMRPGEAELCTLSYYAK